MNEVATLRQRESVHCGPLLEALHIESAHIFKQKSEALGGVHANSDRSM
jgi:hypothetical protein